MRTAAPALLPIYRSEAQGRILARVLLQPDSEFTLQALADQAPPINIGKSALHQEVHRLIDAGLLQARSVGRTLVVKANPKHPAAGPLTQLALLTFGPQHIVAEEFSQVDGAEEVIIFGSWAARLAGKAGPPPNDIDVLIIGETSRLDVFAAADQAQERLGQPVNPEQRTRLEWDQPGDSPLLAEIKHRPYVTVYARDAS